MAILTKNKPKIYIFSLPTCLIQELFSFQEHHASLTIYKNN